MSSAGVFSTLREAANNPDAAFARDSAAGVVSAAGVPLFGGCELLFLVHDARAGSSPAIGMGLPGWGAHGRYRGYPSRV